MDPWLRTILETKTGGFRGARLTKCRRCGAWTITGLDNDVAAFQATVDPSPLTPRQEYLCILAGRRTYDLETSAARIVLHHRDVYGLATPSRYTVVPQHRCGATFPTINIRQRTTSQHTDTPPF